MAELKQKRKGNYHHNGNKTEMRCKTLKKGVNIPFPMLVTHPDDKGYEIVKSCGYEYGSDDI